MSALEELFEKPFYGDDGVLGDRKLEKNEMPELERYDAAGEKRKFPKGNTLKTTVIPTKTLTTLG